MKRKRQSPHSQEDIKKFFAKLNCTLLSTYQCNKDILKYRCNVCGHLNHASFNNVYRCKHPCIWCVKKKLIVGKTQRLKRIALKNKLYTITDAAQMLGVTLQDFYYHLREKKTLPPPTRPCGKIRKYYNLEDIQHIKSLLE